MGERITDKLVRGLTPPESGYKIYYDDVKNGVPGFGIRFTAGGARTFVLNYRNKEGRERRKDIGRYPTWSVQRARKEARELKIEVDRGNDPQGELNEKRHAPTVNDLADRYIKEWGPKKRTIQDDISILDQHIRPKFGTKKVAGLEQNEVERFHQTLHETPFRANRTLALLSKMFSLAVKWKWRTDNPIKGIVRYHEPRRERLLTSEERARIWTAIAQHPNQSAANAVRILILTGARTGETLKATWDEFDLHRSFWTKPAAHTKQKDQHIVNLNSHAVQLLIEMKKTSQGKLLFPDKSPDQPLKRLAAFWARIRKMASLEDVRVHDLRHDFATVLAEDGYQLLNIGKMLGHKRATTTERYAHLTDKTLSEAAEHAGDALTANIVPFKKEGAA